MSQPIPKLVKPETLVLRCTECGKQLTMTLDEALLYAQTSWPRCCGETMLLLKPDATDAKPTK